MNRRNFITRVVAAIPAVTILPSFSTSFAKENEAHFNDVTRLKISRATQKIVDLITPYSKEITIRGGSIVSEFLGKSDYHLVINSTVDSPDLLKHALANAGIAWKISTTLNTEFLVLENGRPISLKIVSPDQSRTASSELLMHDLLSFDCIAGNLIEPHKAKDIFNKTVSDGIHVQSGFSKNSIEDQFKAILRAFTESQLLDIKISDSSSREFQGLFSLAPESTRQASSIAVALFKNHALVSDPKMNQYHNFIAKSDLCRKSVGLISQSTPGLFDAFVRGDMSLDFNSLPYKFNLLAYHGFSKDLNNMA